MDNKKKGGGVGCLGIGVILLAGMILLFLLASFGWIAGIIWLLFFRKKLDKEPKKQMAVTVAVSVLSVLSLGFLIYSNVSKTPLESITISSKANETDLEVGQDYIINIAYSPADADLSTFICNIDGSSASFKKSKTDENKAILHTKSEGKVIISVSNGKIESNSLTLNISNKKETEEPTKFPSETEAEASTEPPKTINDDVDINFSGNVQNDATGNWRLARVTTMKEIQEYALEYYNAYFKSDDEIHAIVNFSLNTTNRLTKATDDILDIAVYDYVSKEEYDAKVLFSGSLLANYHINTSTGEIEEIPLEPESETAAANPPESQGKATENPPDNLGEPSESPDGSQEAANNPPPENSPETADPNVGMVWVSATGSKYHSIPNCGRMDPNKARQVSKEEAAASGLSPCSKCY